MKDIKSIIQELRQPFPAKFVDWKIQTVKKDNTGALVVAFVDARDVSERLNSVCPGQWSNRQSPLIIAYDLQGVTCSITVRDGDTSVTVEDVGIGQPIEPGMKDFERDIRIKTYYSDAFKRAGVKLGIATSLYELPQIWVNEAKQLYKQGETVKGLTNDGKAALKERYDKWVTSELIQKRFGAIYEG